MQTNLEKKALENRPKQIIRNDYNNTDEYSSKHPDALSDGDPQGKGSGNGGHTHRLPDYSKDQHSYDYSEIDTDSSNIGGQYDIEGRNGVGGRNFLKTISLYSSEKPYDPANINCDDNISEGQIVII